MNAKYKRKYGNFYKIVIWEQRRKKYYWDKVGTQDFWLIELHMTEVQFLWVICMKYRAERYVRENQLMKLSAGMALTRM